MSTLTSKNGFRYGRYTSPPGLGTYATNGRPAKTRQSFSACEDYTRYCESALLSRSNEGSMMECASDEYLSSCSSERISWNNLYCSEHLNPTSRPCSIESNKRILFPESLCPKSCWTSQTFREPQQQKRTLFAVNSTRTEDFLNDWQDPHVSHSYFQGNTSRNRAFHDFQIPQTPVRGACCVQNAGSNSISTRKVDSQNLKKYHRLSGVADGVFNEKDGSFLFVTAENAEMLKFILQNHRLEVQDIGKTETNNVWVVLFKTHEDARRAFIMQKDIGLRMVPHICSKKSWFKNPSPKFHVMYETRRRVTVKSGKSLLKSNIGYFLMIDARRERGCTIWADQLKGHRLRVVGYVGKFMSTDGRIEERHAPPTMDERKVIGWISTFCSKSKVHFAVRLSGNQIQNYLYDSNKHALE